MPIDDYVEPATSLPSPSALEPGVGGDETDDSDLASTSSDSSQDSPLFWRCVQVPQISLADLFGEIARVMLCTSAAPGPIRPFVDVLFRPQTLKCWRRAAAPSMQGAVSCFKGDVVSSVEGLVEALDAAKSKRLKVDS